MEKEIVNRVAASGLVNIDPEEIIRSYKFSVIDISTFLWQGMVLREKEFRDHVKGLDLESYKDHYVGIMCSNEAIVPHWAYMLLTNQLMGVCRKVIYGGQNEIFAGILSDHFREFADKYENKRVLVKGCGNLDIGPASYLEILKQLAPHVKSVMYGEACSNVPIHKK